MAHKLASKGFDETAIARALNALDEDGLQSDSRFAQIFVRSHFAKGRGAQRIRQELRFQGVNDEGLEACLAEYDWDAAMARAYAKKFGDAAPVGPKEYAARVRFLSQRGFEADRIQALLRRLRWGGE